MIIAVVVLGLSFWSYKANQSYGAGVNIAYKNLTSDVTPYMNHAVATTTQTNLVLVGNASSTYPFSLETYSRTGYTEQVNFNFLTVNGASSTPATTGAYISNTPLDLIYCYSFSNDQVNWFPLASSCASWNSGVIGTSTLGIAITNVNSKYMRIHFSSSMATSTRVGLWVQAILKQPF